MVFIRLFILHAVLFLTIACNPKQQSHLLLSPIEKAIIEEEDNFYYIDFKKYPQSLAALPIGVFDSGTGGLTILEVLLNYDSYNNKTLEHGSDGLADFFQESFIYLADQANMPYGNYFVENKSDLLREHIIKDIQFLLGNKYYSINPDVLKTDKEQVKAIVIACNTATAYGFTEVQDFINKTGLNIPVIGVIDAASRGVANTFRKDEDGSRGVFATVGTIGSNGYEKAIKGIFKDIGHAGKIKVFNQGGHGVAEAVDEEPDFISSKAKRPRDNYRGPSLDHSDYPIDKVLIDVYNFDFDKGNMLCDNEDIEACQILQINSSENYIRYHLVSLMEQIRKSAMDTPPLKALVLGCTHYPYLIKEIRSVLDELREYRNKDGNERYKNLIADQVNIIDPAEYVAKELFNALKSKTLLNQNIDLKGKAEFYISIPNRNNTNIQLDSAERFTYAFKYGRNVGEIQEYVKVVPFSNTNLSNETLSRLRVITPDVYEEIQMFLSE